VDSQFLEAEMWLAKLEKRGALRVLFYLYNKEQATITDLRKNVKVATDTLYSTLELLLNLGLITKTEKETFPFATYYSLTDLGRDIAKHLARIEEILARAEQRPG